MYNYIKDPLTNNFVTINSNLGKSILKKYLNVLKGGSFEIKRPISMINNLLCTTSLYYHEINFPDLPKKNIIIIGDTHIPCNENSTHSSDIFLDEFIMDIIDKCKNKNLCIDFFYEKPLKPFQFGGYNTSNMSNSSLDTLNYIRALFHQCSSINYNSPEIDGCIIETNKSEFTKYDNLRVHNVDLRQIPINDDSESRVWLSIFQAPFTIEILQADESYPILENLYIWILEGNKDKEPPNIPIIKENPLFNKTFKLIIAEAKKMIIKIHKERINYNANKIYNIEYKDITDTFIKVKNELMSSKRVEFYVHLLALPVDIYIILRMLKKFSQESEKPKRGPKLCRNQNNDMNKIVIFAGDDHAIFLSKILEYLFNNSCKFIITNDEILELRKKNKFLNTQKIKINFDNNKLNKYEFSNFKDIIRHFCNEVKIDNKYINLNLDRITNDTIDKDILIEIANDFDVRSDLVNNFMNNFITKEMFIYCIKAAIINSMNNSQLSIFIDTYLDYTKEKKDQLKLKLESNNVIISDKVKNSILENMDLHHHSRRLFIDSNNIDLVENLELSKTLEKEDYIELAIKYNLDTHLDQRILIRLIRINIIKYNIDKFKKHVLDLDLLEKIEEGFYLSDEEYNSILKYIDEINEKLQYEFLESLHDWEEEDVR
tara:strand:+ start:4992 stop:6965 length:1974 start_codon:yes stop_codon:yes gene_type:complete